MSQRTETLERALVEPPNTGDDWQAVRDAATPELRRSVELYAACRAGEWSHPGGDEVLQNKVLDEAAAPVQALIDLAQLVVAAVQAAVDAAQDVLASVDQARC